MTQKSFPTRSSNNLSIGIVGLPNVGKSTLFNALTHMNVPVENYPFCTINPSEGRVRIDDSRLDTLVDLYKPKNTVNGYLTVIDIAGLIKGASEGQGLGNAFLDNIRRTDGIFHVLRCFEDKEIVHCEDSLDPLRDADIVNTELRLKDKEIISRKYEKMKNSRAPKDKKIELEIDIMAKLLNILEESWVNEKIDMFNDEEIKLIGEMDLLTTKNVVYLANISCEDFENRKVNKMLKDVIGQKKNVIIVSSDYLRNNIDEKRYKDLVGKIVKRGYETLNLINFFTAGPDEVRSWTLRRGMKAPQAGAVIHSDFEERFVMAEIFSFDDLLKYKSENEVKKEGKYYQRGKNYVVEDGDIILFKCGKKKK